MKYVFLFWAYIHEIMFFGNLRVPMTLCFESSNEFGQAHLLPVRLELFRHGIFESAYDAATEMLSQATNTLLHKS